MKKSNALPVAAPQLPSEGYVRLAQIIGDPKANPPIPAVLPICRAGWWNGIKAGKFPKGIKLGPRTTVWKVSDIRDLLNRLNGEVTE